MSGKNWNAPGVSQENNAVENLIQKGYSRNDYLETCGTSSLEAALDALGVAQEQCGRLQPSDYYTMILNDPQLMPVHRWGSPGNRVFEAYPLLLQLLYPSVQYKMHSTNIYRETIEKCLLQDDSVCILNLRRPGHYIAALHYEAGRVLYNESWLNNFWNRGTSRKRWINIEDLVLNLKNQVLQIYL